MPEEPSTPHTPVLPAGARIYRIRVEGHPSPRLTVRLTDRLGPMAVRHHADGTTTLTGPVADQAALYGLLRRIRDLSLPLLAVVRVSAADDDVDRTQP